MNWTRLVGATIISAAIGFFIHVIYGQGIAIEYVKKAAVDGRLSDIIRQPYPNWVVAVALLTALIPTLGKVLLYIFIQDRLPSQNKIIKGFIFGFLLLFIGDNLLRMPIMGAVTGNPFDVVVVQSLEKWIIYPAMGIVIALLAPENLFKRILNKTN